MKYIRTKDGIYKATEINGMIVARGGVAYSCDIADVHFPIVFKKQDIIKQADTIEELVDGYYVDVDNQSFTLSECYDNLEDAKKSYKDWISYSNRKYLEYTVILYAFIKTNKGLIYVAKMNDKGELELL